MYIILLLYLFFIIFNNDKLKRRNSFNTHYFILLLLTVLMAGLSYRMGYDSLKYEDTFSMYSNKIGKLGNVIWSNGFREPGWIVLNVVVNAVFGDFVYLKLLIALFVNSVIFWFFKKHLSNPGIGVFLYLLFVGWTINFEILRASIAIAFFLIAIDKLLSPHPSYAKFYLCFLPALLFHWFAFLILITPLFFLVKPNNTFIIVAIIAGFLTPYIITIGLDYNVGLFSQVMGERIDTYMTSDKFGSRGLNINGVIFSVMTVPLPIVYLCFTHKKEVDSKIISITLAYALFNILRNGLDVLYRITDYYVFIMVLMLATVLLNNKHSEKTVTDRLCMLLIAISITMTLTSDNVWKRYIPYTSIFNKEYVKDREELYKDLGYDDMWFLN